MLRAMKGTIFVLFVLALALFPTGCTTGESATQRVGQRLSDGLQGRGQIVPNNPTSDSFGPTYR